MFFIVDGFNRALGPFMSVDEAKEFNDSSAEWGTIVEMSTKYDQIELRYHIKESNFNKEFDKTRYIYSEENGENLVLTMHNVSKDFVTYPIERELSKIPYLIKYSNGYVLIQTGRTSDYKMIRDEIINESERLILGQGNWDRSKPYVEKYSYYKNQHVGDEDTYNYRIKNNNQLEYTTTTPSQVAVIELDTDDEVIRVKTTREADVHLDNKVYSWIPESENLKVLACLQPECPENYTVKFMHFTFYTKKNFNKYKSLEGTRTHDNTYYTVVDPEDTVQTIIDKYFSKFNEITLLAQEQLNGN